MRPSSIWLKVFFSGCGFEFSWFFNRQRWKLFPSATYALPKIWGGLQPPSPPRPVRLCFCHGAETRDPRAEADPIGIRDRWIMNPLTTRLRCLLPNLLPHLTYAKRVFWPYIIYKTKKFLEKKFQWPNKYTKCRVSYFLTRYYHYWLQYWSGNYWDNFKDIILPFPFQAFFF